MSDDFWSQYYVDPEPLVLAMEYYSDGLHVSVNRHPWSEKMENLSSDELRDMAKLWDRKEKDTAGRGYTATDWDSMTDDEIREQFR